MYFVSMTEFAWPRGPCGYILDHGGGVNAECARTPRRWGTVMDTDTVETASRVPLVVLGIPFDNVTFGEAVDWVRRRIETRKPAYIATANLDFVMQAWRDPELQRILLEADLVVADGAPIVRLSRWFGPPLRQRVTGSDLVPMLARMARENGRSLFLLGGAPGVAEKAAAGLCRREPGLAIAGCHSPPQADLLSMDHAGILARIESAAPDLLLIAFGAPKQEKFANLHVRKWKVPVSIGVGGTLDFLAGAQTRAPRWVQALSLEWLWRMLTNPTRLAGRYAANLAFLVRAGWRLLRLRAGAPVPSPEAAAEPPNLGPDAAGLVFRSLPDADAAAAFVRAGLLETRGRPLAVDLAGADWLSSLDLGALLKLGRDLRARGAALMLLRPGPRAKRLLAESRLTEYFEVFDTPQAARTRVVASGGEARTGDAFLSADGSATLRLPAELTAANLDAFRAVWAKAAVNGTPARLTVDFRHARFIDSSGLGFLAGLARDAATAGGSVRWVSIGDRIRRIVAIAKLDRLIVEDGGTRGPGN
jgi:N-acetylglucosaminyldiphosphoundecaprenol N-acetyl-beta-D-mannosaminyltransferase